MALRCWVAGWRSEFPLPVPWWSMTSKPGLQSRPHGSGPAGLYWATCPPGTAHSAPVDQRQPLRCTRPQPGTKVQGSWPERELAPPRKGRHRKAAGQEGEAASGAERRSPGTRWKGESDREEPPGQASRGPEAEPLPGCENTGITTFWHAKTSHLILIRILFREREMSEDTKLPVGGCCSRDSGAQTHVRGTVPRQPAGDTLHFCVSTSHVPSKSLCCHREARGRWI